MPIDVPELSKGVISLLVFLLPGFVVGWVYYGLTSHPRPEKLERIIEALIFTFVVQALVPVLKWALLAVGHYLPWLPWDRDTQLVASLVISVAFGALLTVCTNKDIPHRWFRKMGFTLRTAHPSEWFCTFSQVVSHVVLQLKDGRRIQGWPKEWPVDPSHGQFYLEDPAWITEAGTYLALTELDGILVPATDIAWVEFQRLESSSDVESNEEV